MATAALAQPLVISNAPTRSGKAPALVDKLLAMPGSLEDPQGRRNAERWALQREIAALGDEALAALQEARPRAARAEQLRELTQTLGMIKTPAATKALLGLLGDKDEAVRQAAIIGTWDRADQPEEQGGNVEMLEALEKHVVTEKSWRNRDYVCVTMSRALKLPGLGKPQEGKPDDKRAAVAVRVLKERLRNDPELRVRRDVAIYLTQMGDASGAETLKEAVLALVAAAQADKKDGVEAIEDEFALDRLVPAVERASGRTFGPLPMNPILRSSAAHGEEFTAGRRAVLEKLAQWAREKPAATQGAAK